MPGEELLEQAFRLYGIDEDLIEYYVDASAEATGDSRAFVENVLHLDYARFKMCVLEASGREVMPAD
jgi:hypothetical protein